MLTPASVGFCVMPSTISGWVLLASRIVGTNVDDMVELGADTAHVLDVIEDRKPLPGPEANQAFAFS
jgi:hypothetical protein